MNKPDVGDGDLGQGLYRRTEEPEENTIGGICSCVRAKWRGSKDYNVSRDGEKIDRTFAVLQRNRLPEDASPTGLRCQSSNIL